MTQREQFEQFAEKNGYDIRKTGSGCFSNIAVDISWEAWQSAQAAKDAEIAELRANLAKCRELIKSVENYPQSTFISNMKNWSHYKQAKEACGL